MKYKPIIILISLIIIFLLIVTGCLDENDQDNRTEPPPNKTPEEQIGDNNQNPDQDLKGKITIGGIAKEYYYDSGTESTDVNFDYYWCTYYAARVFQKIAPSPKVNWGGDANQWYINAGNNGWVTTNDHSKVTRGSILLMGNHAQIVRDVRSYGLIVQGMNEGWAAHHDPLDPNHQEHWYGGYKFYTGYVYKYYLTYEQIGSGYVFGDFKGYILPVRLGSSGSNNEQVLGVESQKPLTFDEAKRKEIVDFLEKATSHLFIIFPEFYDSNNDIGNDELINLLIFNGITPYSWDASDGITRFKGVDVDWAAKTIFGPQINDITHRSVGQAIWEESEQEYHVYAFGPTSYIETHVISILEESDRYLVDVIHLQYYYGDYDRLDETDVYDEDGNKVFV